MNIVYRVCVTFVPNSDDTDLCVCNRPSSHDHSKDQAKTDEKWDMQHNTCVRLNPEHGKLPNSAWVSVNNKKINKSEKNDVSSLLDLRWIRT